MDSLAILLTRPTNPMMISYIRYLEEGRARLRSLRSGSALTVAEPKVPEPKVEEPASVWNMSALADSLSEVKPRKPRSKNLDHVNWPSPLPKVFLKACSRLHTKPRVTHDEAIQELADLLGITVLQFLDITPYKVRSLLIQRGLLHSNWMQRWPILLRWKRQ